MKKNTYSILNEMFWQWQEKGISLYHSKMWFPFIWLLPNLLYWATIPDNSKGKSYSTGFHFLLPDWWISFMSCSCINFWAKWNDFMVFSFSLKNKNSIKSYTGQNKKSGPFKQCSEITYSYRKYSPWTVNKPDALF